MTPRERHCVDRYAPPDAVLQTRKIDAASHKMAKPSKPRSPMKY
jgi:hypothetical protein